MINVRPTFEEIATYVLALLILLASFYGLANETQEGTRLVYAGFIGSVLTWAFQRNATKEATRHTIDAQNNGLQEMRKTVGRIEDGRLATAEERVARDAQH